MATPKPQTVPSLHPLVLGDNSIIYWGKTIIFSVGKNVHKHILSEFEGWLGNSTFKSLTLNAFSLSSCDVGFVKI